MPSAKYTARAFPMADSLRILVVASDPAIVEGLTHALSAAGIDAAIETADSPDGLGPEIDLVVSSRAAGSLADGALTRLAHAEDRAGALLADLASTRARYDQLVEGIPAVTYIADFDRGATLHYVSPQIEELLGWPPAAFLEDQGLWYRCMHAEDRDRVMAAEHDAWSRGERFEQEYRMVARDGRERWVWETDSLIDGPDGRPTHTQGVLIDVTPMRTAQNALRDERHRAQRYLDLAGAVIVILDADERVSLVNRAGNELLGYGDGELIGRDWFATLVPAVERDAARAALHDVVDGHAEDVLHESSVLTRDGESRLVAWRHTVITGEDGAGRATMSSGVDLTERRAAEQQIAYLAYHDSLTGLPNRALLEEHLELALARAIRQGSAVALLYLDLDGFKLVNDSLGHAAGDELLCQVSMRLAERRRGSDLLARHGGDEFLLLLGDIPREGAESTARRVAEGLLEALSTPFEISGAEFHIGASIGISLFPRDATEAEQLLRHADASMYEAKADGRNAISLYEGEAQAPLERLSMTSRVRKALARDEFILHWQPIVDPADGRLAKLEALIRWEDPFRGLVAPSEFIGFAEETGFIDPIGDWVVSAVVDQLLAWERDGFVVPDVTLNVSPRQLRRRDFGQRLLRIVGDAQHLLARLTIEVTESAAMAEPHHTDPVLRDLAAAGIGIAVDDFGAGYSSLARLRELPVQLLKIDQSFLQGVPQEPGATAIVTAIIELAAALEMAAVAEGVETEEQRRFLVQRGCPLAQGFLLGRPVAAVELEPLLSRDPD
jgi:diguanylate cyclase (GGDEF)-like protein/PAS domain S-box-containing protein